MLFIPFLPISSIFHHTLDKMTIALIVFHIQNKDHFYFSSPMNFIFTFSNQSLSPIVFTPISFATFKLKNETSCYKNSIRISKSLWSRFGKMCNIFLMVYLEIYKYSLIYIIHDKILIVKLHEWRIFSIIIHFDRKRF